ncbi:MAG: 3-deoxy-8-phosphooctulonate synthase [Parachlamydiales bacterium]|nr:3-deoxy-8-phosphooctulonate synthase [Parachlamydiales bacterium]
MKKIKIKDFFIKDKLTFISGPCVIENEEHLLYCATELTDIFSQFDINFIFKASFDKANRSSVDTFRGPGLEKGLEMLQKVKDKFSDLPITTDIHLPTQAKPVSEVADIIQIPAFLCRQTDLLVEAGKTKKVINIKKGQFMAPWDMQNAVDKVKSTGNDNIILTDRGTSFGYNNLVSDFRAIPIMKKFGYPVCFDASHSTQLPGGQGHYSGGQREFIPYLTKAAIAVGADIIFIESHPSPKDAKSDSKTVMDFKDLKILLKEAQTLYNSLNLQPSLC